MPAEKLPRLPSGLVRYRPRHKDGLPPQEALLDDQTYVATRQFVNTGVRQLAECLLAYMGEREPERFRAAVRAIDPAAMAERSFWWHEAAGLAADAEPHS